MSDLVITKAPSRAETEAICALATISAVSCLCVVMVASYYPVLRQPPSRFVRARSLFGLCCSLTLVGYSMWVLLPQGLEAAEREALNGICRADLGTTSLTPLDIYVMINHFWETGIVLWQLVLALDILSIVRNPFKPDRHQRQSVLFVWVTSAAVALATLSLLIKEQHKLWSPDDPNALGRCAGSVIYQFPAVLAFQVSIDVLVLVCSIAVTVLVVARLRNGLPISLRSRRRVRRMLLTYTIGFGLSDAVALVMHAQLHRGAGTLMVFALRGALDCLVWVVANYRGLVSADARNQGVEQGLAVSPAQRSSTAKLDVAEELRYELVLLTAYGIGQCTSEVWVQNVQRQTSASCLSGLASTAFSPLATPRSTTHSEHSGGPAPSSAKAKPSPHATPLPSPSGGLPLILSTPSTFAPEPGPLAQADELKMQGLPDPATLPMPGGWVGGQAGGLAGGLAGLAGSFFGSSADSLPQLQVNGVSTTGGMHPKIQIPGTNGQYLNFYDYGTETFASVRQALGIDGGSDRYSCSFQAVNMMSAEYSNRDKARGFREIISSGASGSYFYFTPDRQYIVKTISKAEKQTLMASGTAYAHHCAEQPDTLISYLGCHSIRLPLNTCKVYVVVMQNVLRCKPDMCFDLKGATSNRQRARGAAQRALLSGERPASSFSTLLDKDWMALGLKLNLSEPRKRALCRTLTADARFLHEQMLMDYSLLLGVMQPQEAEARPVAGALQGEGGEIYFIGLIDILERWQGVRWKVQGALLKMVFRYFFCSRWYNPEGISAIPPGDYAARFVEFLNIHMLGLPPEPTPSGGKSWHPFW